MSERSYDEQPPTVDNKDSGGGFWKEIVKFTFITLVIVIPFRLYVAQPFVVSGASMDPTFTDGEYLIVDQISKRFETPQRESVVIFKYPRDPSKFFIKRIIGLPGETVKIADGTVTIFNKTSPSGLVLDEPYVADRNKKDDNFTVVLNPGEYFVLGDNRLGSFDSRSWGAVPEKLIVGRPLVRLLPLTRLNFLPGNFSG